MPSVSSTMLSPPSKTSAEPASRTKVIGSKTTKLHHQTLTRPSAEAVPAYPALVLSVMIMPSVNMDKSIPNLHLRKTLNEIICEQVRIERVK